MRFILRLRHFQIYQHFIIIAGRSRGGLIALALFISIEIGSNRQYLISYWRIGLMANEYAFLDNNHHPTLLGVSPTGEIRRLIVGDDGAVWIHTAPPAIVLYNLNVSSTQQNGVYNGGITYTITTNP